MHVDGSFPLLVSNSTNMAHCDAVGWSRPQHQRNLRIFALAPNFARWQSNIPSNISKYLLKSSVFP